MASARVPRVQSEKRAIPNGRNLLTYEEAVRNLSQDQAFKATVYAINTLLMQKGLYSAEEFRFHFRQSAQRQLKKAKT